MSRHTIALRVLALSMLAQAAALALPAPLGGPAASEKRVTAQGRLISEKGEPLAGWPVTLIATQRYVEFSKFTSGGDIVTAASGLTDAGGYFSLDVPKDRRFQFWFLRFIDPATFDAVRFQAPGDLEITADARRGRVAQVELTIKFHSDWAEVERRISAAGGETTPKGKILRTLGLPEKLAAGEASTEEEWWYFTKGIVYIFRGAEPIGSRHFDPVKPPPGGPSGHSGGGR